MKRTEKEAYVSYKLIEDLRDNEEAQIAYIKASLKDNFDMPSAILSAIENIALARGFRKLKSKI